MSKVISLEDFKKSKKFKVELKNIELIKEEEIDIDERVFLEMNTECDNFEELWEM